MSTRAPFPLAWPEGWPRASKRRKSDFSVTLSTAIAQVQRELRLLRASRVVITSNLPVSSRGVPYAASRAGDDPGIAVWWVTPNSREMVMACDTFRSPAENMRAIGKSLEALRGLKRWATTSIAERAFAGFAALPAGVPSSEPVHARPWREMFRITMKMEALDAADLLAIVKDRHRKLAKENHPDHGGSSALMAELNIALDEAQKELGVE